MADALKKQLRLYCPECPWWLPTESAIDAKKGCPNCGCRQLRLWDVADHTSPPYDRKDIVRNGL